MMEKQTTLLGVLLTALALLLDTLALEEVQLLLEHVHKFVEMELLQVQKLVMTITLLILMDVVLHV